MVVQMVAFNNPKSQPPQFLQSMENAGYRQVLPNGPTASADQNLWRVVHGRRWYAVMNKGSLPWKQIVLLNMTA